MAVPLRSLLDDAAAQMPGERHGLPLGDGFLFSGNRHESVPRALFLDRRLTPLERNAWQVFRLLLNGDGVTAFPTYDQLRPYLASMPCAPKASYETVARALILLRLTRWLSLARRRRDPRTGRLQGNLYVLHDEPLTPFEAMQVDTDYLSLVSQALTHASKAIQRVGQEVLREIREDPLLSDRTLPTRFEVLAQRLHSSAAETKHAAPSNSEESRPDLLRNSDQPPSESEVSDKPLPHQPLPIPNKDRTVRTVCNKHSSVHTVPRARAHLSVPKRFEGLKHEQRSGALVALGRLDAALQQVVLDEWEARCQAGGIRNPAGYLFGMIQKALKGEFRAWAVKPSLPLAAISPDRLASLQAPVRDWSPPTPEPEPQLALSQLRHLQQLFKEP